MKQDISIIRGTTNSFVIHVEHDDGPFSTSSGQRVVFAVKKNIMDKTPILIKKLTTFINPGDYWLGIEAWDTVDLLPGKYYYDVCLVSDNNNSLYNIIEPSEFIIKPSVYELE